MCFSECLHFIPVSLSFSGLAAAAAAPSTRQSDSADGPTLSTFLSSSPSPSSSSSSSSSTSSSPFAVANGPQTDATNHTFKSLAFLDASFGSDLFAHTDTERERDQELDQEPSESLPIFDFGMPRNITGRTGHTEAIIKCRVDSLHDKSVSQGPLPFRSPRSTRWRCDACQGHRVYHMDVHSLIIFLSFCDSTAAALQQVSWIRKRDLHILTVGTATYTTDKRFQVGPVDSIAHPPTRIPMLIECDG